MDVILSYTQSQLATLEDPLPIPASPDVPYTYCSELEGQAERNPWLCFLLSLSPNEKRGDCG